MAASPFQSAAAGVAAQYGIPADIFSSMIGTESSWNPTAQASGSSAYGLGQMTTAALKDVGASAATNQTPQQQLNNSAAYLAQQYKATGSWGSALGAYNQGLGGANSAAGQAYASKVLGGTSLGSSTSAFSPQNFGSAFDGDGSADAATMAGQAGGNNTTQFSGISGWITGNAGNIALVVMGIMVVGVALVASVHTQDILLKTVGSAVV